MQKWRYCRQFCVIRWQGMYCAAAGDSHPEPGFSAVDLAYLARLLTSAYSMPYEWSGSTILFHREGEKEIIDDHHQLLKINLK